MERWVMMEKAENYEPLLRALPKVDELLQQPCLRQACEAYGRTVVVEQARSLLEGMRVAILAGGKPNIELPTVALRVSEAVQRAQIPSLRRVINATGIVLHTNLGRAVLSDAAAKAAGEVGRGYSTLEYDCGRGERGSRYSHVEGLICKLCSCESALVVNNNAAAVLLILSTMVKGKEAVVSRGELVEIGGAFRVPEIMEQSGGILREVGTTNKTHPRDYIDAINEQTGALLKVHTSNYKIVGFTEEVSLADLCVIGKHNQIPVIYDLGGGALLPLERYGIHGEPNVPEVLATGVDVVSFSGDKLLGGPQAGIICGKREYIDQMKRNPLTRAIRIDKLTLAALEATLRAYLDTDRAEREIPTVAMLHQSLEQLEERGRALQQRCKAAGIACVLVEEEGQVGGGSVPTQMLRTTALALGSDRLSPDAIEARLREHEPPVIARIAKDRVLLDMRTVRDSEVDELVAALRDVLISQ